MDVVIAFKKSITLRHNGNCSNSNFFPPSSRTGTTTSTHPLFLATRISTTPIHHHTPLSQAVAVTIVWSPHRVYNKLLASFTLSLSLSLSASPVVYICTNTLVDDALSTAIEKLSRILKGGISIEFYWRGNLLGTVCCHPSPHQSPSPPRSSWLTLRFITI